LLAFGACLQKANVTAKKENAFSGTGVMLKKSIRFEGRDKMRVMVSFSKTNQFSERTHETLIHEVPGLTAFCAVSVARRAMALNQLPGGPDAPLLCHTKAGGQQVALTHSVFDHWLKTKLKTAGLQPERYSGHSFRRGAATLAFDQGVPRAMVKNWGDWASDAVDEYHEMTAEQRSAIPRMVADSMRAAVATHLGGGARR